jgi:SagB-type dehydrogenase family enzyme
MKYRRGRFLVLYWEQDELVFENYALRKRISADPLLCRILNFCGEWRTTQAIAKYLEGYSEHSVSEALKRLHQGGVLDRSDCKPAAAETAMGGWATWNPAAGFFHFATKDTQFAEDPEAAFEQFKKRVKHSPMPRLWKRYAGAARTKLPALEESGEFVDVLMARRTWRKFGQRRVTREELARLLWLTFGIQGWVKVPGVGKLPIKTSPSGGDLHPIEAYVLAQNVEGLRRGIYYYNAKKHELEWLRGPLQRKAVEKNLAGQWWFARAGFLVAMTAVFGRSQWKYPFARSYRVLLAEAGHFCQTFCLTATWLRLAPFCTMAQADTVWEKWLGVDGVNESVLYVAGAGTRPGKGDDSRQANLLRLEK